MDPISDMLTRIRNAQKAEHKSVIMPLSKIKLEISKILKKEGYINDFSARLAGALAKQTKSARLPAGRHGLLDGQGKGSLQIDLKFPAAINEIKRISKPGQRFYIKADKIKQIKNGYGISIISTPKGLMTNKEAKRSSLGGEVLLEIW